MILKLINLMIDTAKNNADKDTEWNTEELINDILSLSPKNPSVELIVNILSSNLSCNNLNRYILTSSDKKLSKADMIKILSSLDNDKRLVYYNYCIEVISKYLIRKLINSIRLGDDNSIKSSKSAIKDFVCNILYKECTDLPDEGIVVMCKKSNEYEYINYTKGGKWQVLTPDGENIISWRHINIDDLNKYLSENFILKK